MKEKTKTNYLIVSVVVAFAVLIALMAFSSRSSSSQGQNYDEFAQCVADSGAKMYGAWWCSHCNAQKTEFGSSWKILENQNSYVECSTQTKTQTQVCKDAGITGYPTWRFADGTEQSGRLSFEYLSQKTGCPLA